VGVSKKETKNLFREGEDIRILVGTDSLSEGLNLQTCGRLVNFDMPWNFMRVEQRIGRVDRIGGQPVVEATNLSTRTRSRNRFTGIASLTAASPGLWDLLSLYLPISNSAFVMSS